MKHTPDHVDCPGCAQLAFVSKLEIARDLVYPEAARIWIESREFNAGRSGRSRFVSPRSLRDFEEYNHALVRFFGKLRLKDIHLGHIRRFQQERAEGLLGTGREELFPRFAAQLARRLKVSVEQVQANPEMLAIVEAQVAAYPQREVGPNKINQEAGMLVRILRTAGVWTPQMEESYEPLQHQESDVPRALSPDEQALFLRVAQERSEFVYGYAVLGIHCTLSTKEERSLRLGDINLGSRVLLIRTTSSKNKYRTRTIPMTDEAHWAAERLIERANALGSTGPQHYLFPFRVVRGQFDPDRPMTVSGVKFQWNEIRRAAGLPWFTPYDLRHTGCTRYAEDGMSIHVLMAMAGHFTRKMQQHYVHISEQAKRRAVERTYAPGKKRPEAVVPTVVNIRRGN